MDGRGVREAGERQGVLLRGREESSWLQISNLSASRRQLRANHIVTTGNARGGCGDVVGSEADTFAPCLTAAADGGTLTEAGHARCRYNRVEEFRLGCVNCRLQ